jgi:hypothetical protein
MLVTAKHCFLPCSARYSAIPSKLDVTAVEVASRVVEGHKQQESTSQSALCGSAANVDGNWCTYNKDRIEYTIPAKTPPGEYLVRVEHIGLHEEHKNRAQFYITCAQLKINGPGGGNPSPLIKIPGIYKQADPGIAYDKWNSRLAPYIIPGPSIWDGN